jgi:hypothetical protein
MRGLIRFRVLAAFILIGVLGFLAGSLASKRATSLSRPQPNQAGSLFDPPHPAPALGPFTAPMGKDGAPRR